MGNFTNALWQVSLIGMIILGLGAQHYHSQQQSASNSISNKRNLRTNRQDGGPILDKHATMKICSRIFSLFARSSAVEVNLVTYANGRHYTCVGSSTSNLTTSPETRILRGEGGNIPCHPSPYLSYDFKLEIGDDGEALITCNFGD